MEKPINSGRQVYRGRRRNYSFEFYMKRGSNAKTSFVLALTVFRGNDSKFRIFLSFFVVSSQLHIAEDEVACRLSYC